MLKKLVLSIFPLILMSCKENNKEVLQELINQKEYSQAMSLAKDLHAKNSVDSFYNGSLAYLMTLECVEKNCAEESPEKLKKIKLYLDKSNGLSKVSDAYFIDYYALSIEKLVKYAVNQKEIADAKKILKQFVGPKNNRLSLVYNELFKSVTGQILKEDLKKSSIALNLIKELNFNLSQEQKLSIELLLSFEQSKDLKIMKDKVRSFNRVFIDKKLPKEVLIALAPAVVEYSLNKNLESIDILTNTVEEKPRLLDENFMVLSVKENKPAYAKGLELITNSKAILARLADYYGLTHVEILAKLQKVSLILNPNNENLWHEYISSSIALNDVESIYSNINLDILNSNIIVSNNEKLLSIASEKIASGSIIDVLNEIVFSEKANKSHYTQRVYDLVEKALKVEISKNNLEGIFLYLNYIPTMKDKFKDQLNQKLNQYILISWDKNEFDNLDRLLDLYSDLNPNNKMLSDLYKNYLESEKSATYFKADNIDQLIKKGTPDHALNKDMQAKYNYIKNKIEKSVLEAKIFTAARKMEGNYTQSKVFTFFADSFSKKKSEDLVIDSISNALDQDQNISLKDLISLSDYLLEKIGKLPNNFIKDEIFTKYKTRNDVIYSWNQASAKTQKALTKYNKDVAYLIKAKQFDDQNKKITASKYISKIKSQEIMPFAEFYKKSYDSYVNSIVGFYVKQDAEKGPEIIKIAKTNTLLKVDVSFISRLGKIENLDKYKLDRGEVIFKQVNRFYNPIKSMIKMDLEYNKKEKSIFAKDKYLTLDGSSLSFAGSKYLKTNKLFELGKKYGVVTQVTNKTKDNFHILPEGSSLTVVESVGQDVYKILVMHPATNNQQFVNAKYDNLTETFSFQYDYYIKLLDKNFSAKAKCQFVDYKVYCAVQDKYWKRERYSVIVKALSVKN